MCIDLKDFYLGTPMNRYKYMWIKMSDIPQYIINQYRLKEKAVNGKVLFQSVVFNVPSLLQAVHAFPNFH